MKKSILIILAILVVAGIATYLYMKNKKSATAPPMTFYFDGVMPTDNPVVANPMENAYKNRALNLKRSQEVIAISGDQQVAEI